MPIILLKNVLPATSPFARHASILLMNAHLAYNRVKVMFSLFKIRRVLHKISVLKLTTLIICLVIGGVLSAYRHAGLVKMRLIA